MSAKKLRVELLDGAGQPAAGVRVKVTGCEELQSGPNGQVLFLPQDEAISVTVNGADAYQGSVAGTPEKLVFKQAGAGWQAA